MATSANEQYIGRIVSSTEAPCSNNVRPDDILQLQRQDTDVNSAHTLYHHSYAGSNQHHSTFYASQQHPSHELSSVLSHHTIPTIPEGSTIGGTPSSVLSSGHLIAEKAMASTASTPTLTIGTTASSLSGDNSNDSGSLSVGGCDVASSQESSKHTYRPHHSIDHGSQDTVMIPAENDDGETMSSSQKQQKAKRYNPASYPVALKLLVSNNVAGSIIGRAGQTISELQTQSNARIKLSQSNEYYPGTQDRVCLIQGEVDPMKNAIRLLLERLYMLQEHQYVQQVAWKQQRQKDHSTTTRSESGKTGGGNGSTIDFVIRLLVPTAACGMLIGKSGSNIKYMEETTGVTSVRLSPKEIGADASTFGNPGFSGGIPYGQPGSTSNVATGTTLERIVTITGPTLDSCTNCANLIVDGMILHPDTSRYANMTTSYSHNHGATAQSVGGGMIMQNHQHPLSTHMGITGSLSDFVASGASRGSNTLNSRPHQQISASVSMPLPTSRDSPTISEQQLWNNGHRLGSHQGQSPGNESSSPPRRIASSPDLNLSESSMSTKQQPHTQALPSTNLENDERQAPGRRYDGSGLQYYSSNFVQPNFLHPTSGGIIPPVSTPSNPHQSLYLMPQHQQQQHPFVEDISPRPASHVPAVVSQSASEPNLLAMHLTNSLHQSQSSAPSTSSTTNISPHHVKYSHEGAFPHSTNLVPQTPTMIAPGCFSLQLLISDSMIGSILGRGGRTLNELQTVSGTRIRISQRGEYIPNAPRDVRVVSIRGPTAQAVCQAQFIISQRMVLPSTAANGSSTSSSSHISTGVGSNLSRRNDNQHHQPHSMSAGHQNQSPHQKREKMFRGGNDRTAKTSAPSPPTAACKLGPTSNSNSNESNL